MSETRADVVLCGGGLANSLIALRLKGRRPGLKVLLLERAGGPEDGHTWSFFDTDVPTQTLRWLAPLRAAEWPGYAVAFPRLKRRLPTGYGSVSSVGLAQAVAASLAADQVFGVDAAEVTPTSVRAADGRVFSAPLVIDGRGARPSRALALGWQKFVGLELRTAEPHGLAEPIVMDADLPQLDGYRFLYSLPFGPDRLLVEDTRYSDGPGLDLDDLADEARAYAERNGWRIAEVLRREHGVLPVALGGDIDAFWAEAPAGVPQSGMRAALFHPTTGYSLPEAAQLADAIADAPELSSAAIDALVRTRSQARWRDGGYFRLLNRMMFLAAAPEQRWRVLARFYRLPQPLIERFYAGRLTWADKARLLAGEPPVPVGRAMRVMREGAAFTKVANA